MSQGFLLIVVSLTYDPSDPHPILFQFFASEFEGKFYMYLTLIKHRFSHWPFSSTDVFNPRVYWTFMFLPNRLNAADSFVSIGKSSSPAKGNMRETMLIN